MDALQINFSGKAPDIAGNHFCQGRLADTRRSEQGVEARLGYLTVQLPEYIADGSRVFVI